MFAENRFFGGLTHEFEGKLFVDVSSGETGSFAGYKHILISGIEVYRLDYHGGLIRD